MVFARVRVRLVCVVFSLRLRFVFFCFPFVFLSCSVVSLHFITGMSSLILTKLRANCSVAQICSSTRVPFARLPFSFSWAEIQPYTAGWRMKESFIPPAHLPVHLGFVGHDQVDKCKLEMNMRIPFCGEITGTDPVCWFNNRLRLSKEERTGDHFAQAVSSVPAFVWLFILPTPSRLRLPCCPVRASCSRTCVR